MRRGGGAECDILQLAPTRRRKARLSVEWVRAYSHMSECIEW